MDLKINNIIKEIKKINIKFLFGNKINIILKRKITKKLYSLNINNAKLNSENSIIKPLANSPSDSIVSNPIFFNSFKNIIINKKVFKS